jgi:hypothetical protein
MDKKPNKYSNMGDVNREEIVFNSTIGLIPGD